LRARGQLAELRAAELRFTAEEVAALLNRSIGLNLSRDEVAALEEETEGWAAGLQLAALSIQASSDANSFIRAFSGSHRFVLDYLAEEVLRRQPENVQTFLLQTSMLERLSGPLCDAVTGRNDSQQMLERLEQANLFLVPLDEKRGWFRYHHLFAEFLRTRNNGDLTGLHRRASQWLEEQGQIDEAIKHALASIDYERAARLIEQVAQAMLMRGELSTLSRWLDNLPGEIMHLRPKLYIFKAWSQVINGQISDAEKGLVEAERALGTVGSEASQIAAIRSLVAAFHIDIPRLLELSGQAIKAMAEDNLFVRSVVAWSKAFPAMLNGETETAIRAFSEAEKVARKAGNLLVCVSSLCQMAELNISKGQLREAARIYREAIQFAQEYNPQQPLTATGMAYMGLSMVLIEWNELDEATRYANQGIEASKEWGELITVDGYVSLVRLKNIQNDLEGAMECLKKVEQLARQLDNPPIDELIAAHRARIWLRHGLLDEAIGWADKAIFDPSVFFLHTWVTPATLVRIRMAQGRWSDAERYLGYLKRRVESGQLNGHLIEVLILESLVLQARGKPGEALARLEQAFTLAEPEGYVRIFVDEGRPMATLLKSFLESAPLRSPNKFQRYANRLLAVLESPSESKPIPAGTLTLDVASPLLSERELKVLRLVAANLSNQAIARELMVEVSTVKTHLLHIYNKLQIHTRREAVEQARKRKLL
jgi:LuxR family maltose regulon positive regulatory protein